MRKTTTRRAFYMSVISLLLCFAMLVGTTFAWFTDSVESGINTIFVGNFDVTLEYKNTTTNDWKEVDNTTELFEIESNLWEPGVVVYETFKITNNGDYALKYNFSVNFTNQKGKNLADVLQVAVLNEAPATREDAIAAVVADGKPIADFTLTNSLMKKDNADEYTVVIYWLPTDNDNDYYNSSIDLGVKLFATQAVFESDSFGNTYDENAPFDVWDGVVPTEMPETLVVDGDTQTVHVKDAAAFVYLSTLSNEWRNLYTDGTGSTYTNYVNGAGAKYYYSGEWTISLEADIDLGNHPIAPVEIVLAENCGYSTFNGNNHTIRNINATTGLFADGNRASYSNLTLMNVTATRGALAGSPRSSITNVTVKNAIISGENYVGGLVGSAYSSVINCKVENSSVIATGKEAGGLIGYIETTATGTPAEVRNNTVSNVSVYAGERAAGLVAQVNNGVKVYNNTIDTVTVGAADTTKYAADAVISNRITAPENVYDNTVINVTTNDVALVSSTDELKDALKDNAYIILTEGEYTLPTLKDYEGVTIVGGDGAVIGGENASDGFSNSNFGKNTTIKNVTFSGTTNGVRYSYANGGTTTFEDCTFAGDSTYGFHIDQSNGATFIFNNCTFVGFNAFASDLEKVTFTDCTFLSNGNYGHTNIWSVAEFNDCTWGDCTSVSQGYSSKEKKYYGTLIFNSVEESYHHEFIGSAESLVAFQKSVNEGGDSWKGQKVLLVADIDLNNEPWTPIGQTGATEFKGIFDGQDYTIKNLYVDSSARTDEHYSSGLFGWATSGVTIQNVNVDGATVKGNHNVAVIVGYTYSGKITNCHVTNATIVGNHANDGACGDKVGLIAGYAADEARITRCSASNSTVTAGRDGGQLVGCGYDVSVSDCTATNVTVSATGDCTGANVNNAIIGRVMG